MKLKIGKACSYLLALLWGLITIFPLFITFLSSVKDNQGINLGMFKLPVKWLWSNYSAAFVSANIGKAVLNSVFLGIVSTLIVTIVGMLAAYVLSRKKFRLKSIVYSLFIVGVMVPVHCTIIPISSLATGIGGRNSYWYLTLVYAAFNLSQAIFLFTGYLNDINKELDEAAIIDGCNDIQLLFRVLTPVSIPIISTQAILTFIYGYGELIFAMILISDEKKYTVSRAMLSFSGGYQQQLGPIFACIIVAVLPMIILYILFHEKVQSGMLSGAVKG
ncbi:carbohydrate ABC transporter permease [Anaerocolumna sp. MB42-C2]|uniref:carbohydrate ABC transporter permease n=1 Tax=Anaerocolumna sp. MB42-C2 TaxID=3070997 RepID=UPI0027DF13A4|nr:carbohydrate ABC transporter permease [Anaerocolumna sp. MB42-C2]WMJ85706.1 carbohydrate ABC transporter permease [Anaerocolumna sp. MB42-C2]